MNWILVVLQVSALAGTPGHPHQKYGWVKIGEFATEKSCIAASVKLAQSSQDTFGIRNFQCLSKN